MGLSIVVEAGTRVGRGEGQLDVLQQPRGTCPGFSDDVMMMPWHDHTGIMILPGFLAQWHRGTAVTVASCDSTCTRPRAAAPQTRSPSTVPGLSESFKRKPPR